MGGPIMYDDDVDKAIDDIYDQFNPKKGGRKPFIYNPNIDSGMDIKDYGFDESKSVAHGTNLEKSINMNKERELTGGTFVHPGRGGFMDASTWAQNVYKKPVVILAETDQENIRSGTPFGLGWVTLGARGKERKGHDKIYDKVGIKKLMIADVKEDGELEEIFYG